MYNFVSDTKTTRAIINLDNIAHNYLYACKNTGAKVICIVKSDAYGHGAVEVAKRLQKEGADFFAVSDFEEALELRQNGISGKILILGYVPEEQIENAIGHQFSMAVFSLDFAKQLVKHSNGKKIGVHIKLNTGMNRIGFNVSHLDFCELSECIDILKSDENIYVEGLFSHFASSDESEKFTRKQYNVFLKARDYIISKGVTPKICHICNSDAASLYKDMALDAVRLGISLYGCSANDVNYLPCMEFKTKIVATQTLKKGDYASYGLKFKAKKPTKIAIIPIGYADGLKRCLSCSKGYVLCRGKKAKILGRICMNMTIIDISQIPDACLEDDVTVWGKDNGSVILCSDVAKSAGTISYELLVSVAKRVPRIYTNN